jgi:DNA-binding PadR family transcriptional regulator
MTMSSLSYHVLLALADADRHGYGILKEMELRSGGAMRPSTGALYLALQRMEEEGLIEESPERPDPSEDDARRRYYRLTSKGRREAAAESRRLAALVLVAHEKRLLPSGSLRAVRASAGGGRQP